MEQPRTVMVFSFRSLSGGVEMARQAGFKATREQIDLIPGAQLLEGTGEPVAVADLDGQGHFRRIATGWGEL
jgi:hypothetical protein